MTGSPTREEGSARLEFVLDGKKCNMKFLDADVKRLLASVSAVVERGKHHRVRTARVYVESTSTGQRMPVSRRKGVYVVPVQRLCGSENCENGEVRRAEHE